MKYLFLILIIFLLPIQCLGCECSSSDAELGFRSSDRVFGAYVTAAKVQGQYVEIKIDGYARLKGPNDKLKILKTPSSSPACGVPVTVPGRYIFFTKLDGSFTACGASRTYGDPMLGELNEEVFQIWQNLDK